MRALLQRVSRAQVRVDGDPIATIGTGILALVGITQEDAVEDIVYLSEKILNLRIFPNDTGTFDRSLLDIHGEILAVSQFTLYAETWKGRRPSFVQAAAPDKAEPLFNRFVARLADAGVSVQTGQFGAMMDVELVNDGPVTILLDSADRGRSRRSTE